MGVLPLITVAGDVQSFTEPRFIAAVIDTFSINDDGLLTRSSSSTLMLDTKLRACDLIIAAIAVSDNQRLVSGARANCEVRDCH